MIATNLVHVAPHPTAAGVIAGRVFGFHPVMRLVPVEDGEAGQSLDHDRPFIPQEQRNHG